MEYRDALGRTDEAKGVSDHIGCAGRAWGRGSEGNARDTRAREDARLARVGLLAGYSDGHCREATCLTLAHRGG